ncbi:hypothetical protein, partial [Escherichia coli]|uniref:hypothetical protein n=1 Tax=Escherichia coli TaxID=562 RepID=UPI0019D4D555
MKAILIPFLSLLIPLTPQSAFAQSEPEPELKLESVVNRPGFPGECFICELRLPDHRFRWK